MKGGRKHISVLLFLCFLSSSLKRLTGCNTFPPQKGKPVSMNAVLGKELYPSGIVEDSISSREKLRSGIVLTIVNTCIENS